MAIALQIRRFLFISILLGVCSAFSQEKRASVKEIQTLIDQDSLKKARLLVAKNVAHYKAEKKYDSLYNYIQFEGSFKLNNGNKQKAIQKAEALTAEIRKKASPHFVVEAITELGWIYDDAGKQKTSYDLLKGAIPYAKKNQEKGNIDLAGIIYRLGYYASKMGDYPLAKKHYSRALNLLKKSGKPDYVFYNQVYNALGGMMWQEAKLDSAKYYFQEAVKVLEKTDENDPMNRYYRPALIKMNLAVIWNAMGKNSEAIAISEEAYTGFQEYIDRATDEARIFKAKGSQCVVMDNMASFYNTLGQQSRAQELIEFSFEQKKKLYEKNDINLIISHIILAEAKIANRDFEGAAINADQALAMLKNNPGANLYWEVAALFTRASIYDEMGEIEPAAAYYEQAVTMYRNMGAGFAKDYMDNALEYSQFAARNQLRDKALSLATETYNFTHRGDFKNTLQEFYHTVNLAQVHYLLKNYAEAEKYSDEALCFSILDGTNQIKAVDSVLTLYRKPQALLINAKAKYQLSPDKNAFLLKELLQQVESGIAILDQRKKVVTNNEDITLLMSENKELLAFAEKLRLELYEHTKNEQYLNKLIALHESSIYNRIRSRLSLRENVSFQHVPEKVFKRENELKSKLATSIQENPTGGLQKYFEATQQWEAFLDSLKIDYPRYYNMRYATIEVPMENLQQSIPKNTSVVRYLFVDESLYAFVVSSHFKKLIKLRYAPVSGHIKALSNNTNFSVGSFRTYLYELYRALWLPLEPYVKTKKVIIVPDGELFNLSFEMLSQSPLKSFRDFTETSLLNKYDISYNFSLLLLSDHKKIVNYPEDFVAFVPGFTNAMKEDYKLAIKDSVKLDKTYLTLLPQPFSQDLVKQYSRILDGSYFLNENASKELFISHAKEHKIIHIGTHAESNNLSPELSRLIFAKQKKGNLRFDDNSLYSYEIYNIDLSSNLAILTACETGKPTYQAGEGMISLAHAFNYAGSESILTSLWEIDEESSAKILGYFYDNLARGMDKDEALKNAKISYLETAEGRTAAPQYWAGLVLIGNTAPLDLSWSVAWWWYVLAVVVTALLIMAVIKKRKTS